MSELYLFSALQDLTDEEFKRFKWHLKLERWGDIEPIKAAHVSKADREETVDLICQKYEVTGAKAVVMNILAKLSRNDLVTKMSKKLESAGPSIQREKAAEDQQLLSVGAKFIEKVSDSVLHTLMDKLLERQVLTDAEQESFCENMSRGARARDVLDVVRKKGTKASSVLIKVLCEEDPYLAKELQLM